MQASTRRRNRPASTRCRTTTTKTTPRARRRSPPTGARSSESPLLVAGRSAAPSPEGFLELGDAPQCLLLCGALGLLGGALGLLCSALVGEGALGVVALAHELVDHGAEPGDELVGVGERGRAVEEAEP